MQNAVNNQVVLDDIQKTCECPFIEWTKFKNKTILITGITGMIGSFLANVLVEANRKYNLNLKIVGFVRNTKKAKELFKNSQSKIEIVKRDINKNITYSKNIDFIIHCANNTESKSFVEKPIETIQIAVDGTKNILELAKQKKVESILFLSSMEVYGQTDKPLLSEEDLGYMDTLDVRNSYPLGKRMAELLCHSYYKEKNVPVKIARLGQIISSNISYSDTRVLSYFAKCIINKENIILKTTGESIRSLCYITDTINAMLIIMLNGENGEAYNVNNEDYTNSVREIAEKFAKKSDCTNVKIELENTNLYPKNINWALSNTKLRLLGWTPNVSIDYAFNKLINSFKEQQNIKLFI